MSEARDRTWKTGDEFTSDFSQIEDPEFRGEVREAFVTAMKGRLYGDEPLNDAWGVV